jgi:hypothetical protein
VWQNVGGKASKVAIVTGLSDDRWEVIESGVPAGASIIVGPGRILRRLTEGERVTERKAGSESRSDAQGDSEAE